MNLDLQIGKTQEYDTLRQELLDAKRYVFERPLAIAALAAVGVQLFDKPPYIALLLAVEFLAVFNFWFTVNRLQSAARIVAYIQLVLEPSAACRWIGWENALRQYRMWIKTNPNAYEYVSERLEKSAIPDSLMYYPPIYYFHAALIGLAVLAVFAQLRWAVSPWRLAFCACASGVGIWSIRYFRRWKPSLLSTSIERNRVIWKTVLSAESNHGESTVSTEAIQAAHA